MDLSQKVKGAVSDVKTYWKVPKLGRYMTFKEIAAYAGGGIGAYFIITLGSTLLVTTQNMVVGGAIGVSPTDMLHTLLDFNPCKYSFDRYQSEYYRQHKR